MSRKNVLAPVLLVSGQTLSAGFTTTPTNIDFLDNVAYQINVSTTNSVGTFTVQVSLDYVPPNANTLANTGNWTDLNLSAVPTVAAANDTIGISMTQLPYRAIRLKYNSTNAGTGTCSIYIQAKMI